MFLQGRKYKIKKWLLLAVILPVLPLSYSFNKNEAADEYAVKAMFVYNFAKYFDWSALNKRQDFVIGVAGNSSITDKLVELAGRKKLLDHTLKVHVIDHPSDLSGMQIVFIPRGFSHMLEKLVPAAKENSVLIITEEKGSLMKGSHINLMNINGKIRFEMDEKNIRESGMKVSKDLSSLAVTN
jgi:hypothetical protein